MQLSAATQERCRTLTSLLKDLARVPPAAHVDVARASRHCQTGEIGAVRIPYMTGILRLNQLKPTSIEKIFTADICQR